MIVIMLMLLATFASAQDVPYTNRGLDTERDPMVINKNFQDVVDGIRRGNLRNGGTITGQLELLNDGAGGGIKFNDGTVQTTAAGVVTVSSQITTFGSLTSVATVLQKCVNGSTVAVTLSDTADVHLEFYGSMTGNAGSIYRVGFLRDGGYTQGQSSTVGMANNGNQPMAATTKYDFSTTIEDESSGTHSYCLTVASDGATTTVTFPAHSSEQARWRAWAYE